MKLGVLRSIGHNLADSFACGMGLLVGVYHIDVFGEARVSRDGVITVDFLKGVPIACEPSTTLRHAISLYGRALDDLCGRHGAKRSDFADLRVRFGVDKVRGQNFTVTVEDERGRRAEDVYVCLPGRRIRPLSKVPLNYPIKADSAE